MRIPDHLTWVLRNLYAGQEATVRSGHETTDWFQTGKGVPKGVHCHPACLASMQITSCEMLGQMTHKLESRLLGESSITSAYLGYYNLQPPQNRIPDFHT